MSINDTLLWFTMLSLYIGLHYWQIMMHPVCLTPKRRHKRARKHRRKCTLSVFPASLLAIGCHLAHCKCYVLFVIGYHLAYCMLLFATRCHLAYVSSNAAIWLTVSSLTFCHILLSSYNCKFLSTFQCYLAYSKLLFATCFHLAYHVVCIYNTMLFGLQ